MAKQLTQQSWHPKLRQGLRVQRIQIAILLGLLSLALVSLGVVKLWQAQIYQSHLEHKTINQSSFLNAHQLPETIFANAVRYALRGQSDKALSTYALAAARTSDAQIKQAAYFNAGNLYLRLATDKLEKEGLPGWDAAGPLVALAKESYQKALRLNPRWSEAKYNYQLALRLAPTTHGMQGPQQYEDENIKQEEKPSGWPAMPGNPRGMP